MGSGDYPEHLQKAVQASQMWHDIRIKANSDPVLKDMLDQVVIYYRMKYDPPTKS
jgi:hypothetical protein